jgi:hypothetical protein
MGPSINHLLYDGEQYFDEPELKAWPPSKGLVDFCPCEDGTLFISLTTRRVVKMDAIPRGNMAVYVGKFLPMDSNDIYAAAYQVDLEKQTLTVEPYIKDSRDAWMKLPEGREAQQVQKLPIYCWPLFMRLKDACESPDWNTEEMR